MKMKLRTIISSAALGLLLAAGNMTQAADLYYVSMAKTVKKWQGESANPKTRTGRVVPIDFSVTGSSNPESKKSLGNIQTDDLVILDLCSPVFSHAMDLPEAKAALFATHLKSFFEALPVSKNCLVIEPFHARKPWKRIEHPLSNYRDIIRECVLSQQVDFYFPQTELMQRGDQPDDFQDSTGQLSERALKQIESDLKHIITGMFARSKSGVKQMTSEVTGLQESALFESGYLANHYTDNKRGYFLTKTAEGVCQYRIPSLLITQKGTLIAAVNARLSTDGDSAHSRTAFRRSSDLGKTWSKITMDFPKFHGTQDTALVQDRETGRIFGLMIHKHEQGKLYLIHSDDDGETWSKPDNLGRHFREKEMKLLCPGPGVGLQMNDGTLVYSFYAAKKGKKVPTESYMIFSRDHGKTWQAGGSIADYSTETQIAETADGGLVAICRSNGQKGRMKNFYDSQQKRWSKAKPDQVLKMTSCQGALISFVDQKTGKHCTLYSTPTRGRAHGTVYLSFDSGQTWSYSRKINEAYYAYSSMALLPSGQIGLLYEGGINRLTGQQTELVYTALSVDWLMQGQKLK